MLAESIPVNALAKIFGGCIESYPGSITVEYLLLGITPWQRYIGELENIPYNKGILHENIAYIKSTLSNNLYAKTRVRWREESIQQAYTGQYTPQGHTGCYIPSVTIDNHSRNTKLTTSLACTYMHIQEHCVFNHHSIHVRLQCSSHFISGTVI